jgi:IS5 family transposase
VMRR